MSNEVPPTVIGSLTEQIAKAEKEGDSRLAEDLFMDLNTIMELATGDRMSVGALESIECEELRNKILKKRNEINIATATCRLGEAARLKEELWTLLDQAWNARMKTRQLTNTKGM